MRHQEELSDGQMFVARFLAAIPLVFFTWLSVAAWYMTADVLQTAVMAVPLSLLTVANAAIWTYRMHW